MVFSHCGQTTGGFHHLYFYCGCCANSRSIPFEYGYW